MRIFLFTILVFLTGCSETGALYVAKPLDPQKSLVYVYRPDTRAMSARTISIEVDGTKLAEIKNNGYSAFYLEPGHHKMKQSWNYWLGDMQEVQQPLEVTFSSLAGDQHFLRFGSSSEYAFPATIVLMWNIHEVPINTGSQEITTTHYVEPIKPAFQ